MNLDVLQICRIDASLEAALAVFFETIQASGEAEFFHPHPFTAQEASRRAYYRGADLYYALLQGEQIIGYGMLRGWDEGYTIPSLGIFMARAARGRGLGELLMHFLHAAARARGAEKIRLTVYTHNAAAVSLYQKLGYRFEDAESDQVIGYLDL
ncbi:MAG TPA: N-acetyltransferase [Chloroflexi bacterium]|nr:N-acetyltransferase [Chloroflexota bacterium]